MKATNKLFRTAPIFLIRAIYRQLPMINNQFFIYVVFIKLNRTIKSPYLRFTSFPVVSIVLKL